MNKIKSTGKKKKSTGKEMMIIKRNQTNSAIEKYNF